MPDPADTAAGETKSVGNWNNAPGGTTSSNNGTTSSAGGGTTTSNNGGTQTSAPGKTDSEAKTSSTSNNSAPSSSKSTSTSQNISSPATTQSAPATTASPATTNTAPAAAGTSYTPSTTSSVKVADPSRGTMAGNPATGATYTAGSATPTYDPNDGIVSTAEAEARYNAAQAMNSAFGVGGSAPSAPSAPAAPDGAFGPRANPAASYMSDVMGGLLGPVGTVGPLTGSPPPKAITDRVAPPAAPPVAAAQPTYDPLSSIREAILGVPTVPTAPPTQYPVAGRTDRIDMMDTARTDRLPSPASPPPASNSSTVAMNNTGATAGLAQDIQNAGLPGAAPASTYAGYGAPFNATTNAMMRDIALNSGQPVPAGTNMADMTGYVPGDPRVDYPPGSFQNTVDGPPEFQTADGSAAPSQQAGQPQTIDELGNRVSYEADKARDGFKNLPGKIYDAIVGGNITAGQDLNALQQTRGGGGGILPPPDGEPLDVQSMQKLMAELKRRGVSANQQLQLILSTFV